MRNAAKILVLAAGCAVVAGCAGAGSDGQKVVSDEVLGKVGLGYYWTATLELRRGERIDRIYVLDDTLYCLSSSNRLFSVDAMTGQRKWTYDVAKPGRRVYRPLHAAKVLVGGNVSGIKRMLAHDPLEGIAPVDTTMINTRFHLAVLNRKTGRELRKIKFDFAANTAGAADQRRFYVGSARGLVCSFGLQEAIRLSSLYTADVLTAPPVYYQEFVYAGGEDKKFYAAEAGDRMKKLWSRSVDGPITAPFHVDRRACFVPCEDNRLYAFRTRDGSGLWEQPFICQGPLKRGVQVTDNSVLQRAEGDKFYAINLAKGTERWRMTDGLEVLAAFGRSLYIRDVNNNLLIVDEILGRVESSLPMTGFDLFARNVTAPGVWTATRGGKLFCIRPR